MYADPAAVKKYAEKIKTDEAIVKQSITEYQTKEALQTDEMKDLDGAMRDAIKLKFLDRPLTPEQIKEFIQIPPR
jgi:NitT/TauT family transport system substrate-binding protein